MTTHLRDALYQYAIGFLREHGESMPSEVVDGFVQDLPEETGGLTLAALRTKLSSQITSEIKWYGDEAPIQRTGNRTIVLRKG